MFELLYRHWKKAALALAGMIIIILIIEKTNSANINPLPPLNSLTEIKPGETRVSQLQNLPTLYHQQPEGNNQKIYFGQNAPQQYVEITAKDGTVLAIKKTNPQEFEFVRLDEYTDKYGQATRNVITAWREFGFLGYVYDDAGKIIIAHPKSGEIIEEWTVAKNINQETLDQLFPPAPANQGN